MSGLFYVFAKRVTGTVTAMGAGGGRWLLIFPSRYEADEYYRVLQELRNGNNPLFTMLRRASPQLWIWNGVVNAGPTVIGNNHEILNLQPAEARARFEILRDVTILAYLPDANGTPPSAWSRQQIPTLTNIVTGSDWNSGSTFYIRNRRQPDLYWWAHGTHLHASPEQRTKFRIEAVGRPTGVSESEIIIRSDTVIIEVIPQQVGTQTVRQYLSSRVAPGMRWVGVVSCVAG